MVTYRRVNENDIEKLVEIRSIFLREFDGEDHLKNEKNIEIEIEKYLKKFINTDDFIGFVAEDNGEIVGTSAVTFYNILPAVHYLNGKLAYISNIYTIHGYRRKGIARELFKKVLDEALLRDCSKITLHASKEGELVYKDFGFVKTSTEMEYINEKFDMTAK